MNCKLPDCLFDGVTKEERNASDKEDEKIVTARFTESSAVIHTGKRGRPRKVAPYYKSEKYVIDKRRKARERYYKNREKLLEYQKNYYAEKSKDPEFLAKETKRKMEKYYQMKLPINEQRKE